MDKETLRELLTQQGVEITEELIDVMLRYMELLVEHEAIIARLGTGSAEEDLDRHIEVIAQLETIEHRYGLSYEPRTRSICGPKLRAAGRGPAGINPPARPESSKGSALRPSLSPLRG